MKKTRKGKKSKASWNHHSKISKCIAKKNVKIFLYRAKNECCFLSISHMGKMHTMTQSMAL